MAFKQPSFVQEQFSVSGTGNISTTGTTPSGLIGAQPFVSSTGVGADDGTGAMGVGDIFPYSLRGLTTGSVERGIATITAIGNSTLTFSRGVISSSNLNTSIPLVSNNSNIKINYTGTISTSIPLISQDIVKFTYSNNTALTTVLLISPILYYVFVDGDDFYKFEDPSDFYKFEDPSDFYDVA